MDKYQQNAQTWNSLAKIYEEKFMLLDYYNESYDAFAALLNKQNAAILEFGSGPGNIAKYMLEKNPGWKWLGTDVAPAMVELAKQNNPLAVFEVMDARDAGKISQVFDGIVSGFCLPFLSQEDCAVHFKDCSKLLDENGVLYLSFVAGKYEDSALKTGSTGQQVFFHYHPMEVIEQQLTNSGFTIETIMKIQYKRDEKSSEEHSIVIGKKL